MPQPLTEPHTGALFDPNPIKSRPEAAAALANALAAWNVFEWELAIAYSIAMGFYLPGIQDWEPPNHPIAFQIFDSLSGLNARLDLLEKCVALVAPSIAPNVIAMRPAIRKLAGKRAEIAHGRWGVNEHYPNEIILNPQFGKASRWSAKDFDSCAAKFFEMSQSFRAVMMDLRAIAKARTGLMPPPM